MIYKGWINYHHYCDLSKVNLLSINEEVYQFVKKANNKLKIKNRVKAKITRIEKIMIYLMDVNIYYLSMLQ